MACLARRFWAVLLVAGLVVFSIPGELALVRAAGEMASPLPSLEKQVEVKKGLVAFVEIKAEDPVTVAVLYPTQYTKYKATGSAEGGLEFKNITWLVYPIPALLEDQTVYFISRKEVQFHTDYEDINERIDRLMKGEVIFRAGMEMMVAGESEVIRLTPLIPGLKVRIDFSGNARFVIVKTIDLAKYRKRMKSFEQLYEESDLRGSEEGIDFTTTEFEDLYLIVRNTNPVRVRSTIHATKESAESGC